MNDVLDEAIRSAERASRGVDAERPALERKLALVQADQRVLSRPSIGADLVYLVNLADGLGLHDSAGSLLEDISARLLRDSYSLSRMESSGLNRLAVAVAERGYVTAAARLLSVAADGPESLAGLANQAAIELRTGELAMAASLADRVRGASDDADDPSDLNARFVATAVLTEIKRQEGQHEDADRLVGDLSNTARRLVPLFGPDHPRSLSTLITVASAECESAAVVQDIDRMVRAVDAMAIGVQRISAALGTEHPRAVTALRCLAAAEYGLARATDDEGCLESAASLAAVALARGSGRQLPVQPVAPHVEPSPFPTGGHSRQLRAAASSSRAFSTPIGTEDPGSSAGPFVGPAVAAAMDASTASQRPLVRPYAITGGRTHPATQLPIEALVTTTAIPAVHGVLAPEQEQILQLCEEVKSVAEVSALLRVPLGVARVLVADLAAAGLVAIQDSSSAGQAPDVTLLERVLNGLRRL